MVNIRVREVKTKPKSFLTEKSNCAPEKAAMLHYQNGNG